MPFISVLNTAEAVIHGDLGGQGLANILHFEITGGYTQTDIDNLASLIDGEVGSNYLPLMNGNIIYTETTVRGLQNINDLHSVDATSTGTGTNSGNPLPANVSLCVTLRSALSGRSARGRFYAFPPGAGALQSSPNLFTSTYAAAVVTFLNGVAASAAAAGWSLVITSFIANKAPRLLGKNFLVTQIANRNLIADSQRGRLPKGH